MLKKRAVRRPKDSFPTTRPGWAMYYFNLVGRSDHRTRAEQLHWWYLILDEADRAGDLD